MRLLICAGGTGGGVNPALAVLQALPKYKGSQNLALLWIGSIGGMEADLVTKAGVPFEAIPAAGVHGVGARALPGNLWQLSRGVLAARRILARFHPEVIFFTGGFVGIPVAAAARLPLAGMPRPRILLFVPDIEPGLALQALSRVADHVTATTGDTRTFLPGRVPFTATGYPVRSDLRLWEASEARRALGLSDDLPTLVVLGGSRGAQAINRAVLEMLPHLLPEMQVVHGTGQLDWPEVNRSREELAAKLAPEVMARYHPYPYLQDELGAALSIADLVISRAGASTLGELPFYGVPAILIPYPYAWRYQKVNAQYLAGRRAALIIEQSAGDLQAQLLPLLQSLVREPARLASMRQAMQALAQPHAADAIADIMLDLAGAQPDQRM